MGPSQYPQYTRAPKVGGGCGLLTIAQMSPQQLHGSGARLYTYMSPITKGMEGPFTTDFLNFFRESRITLYHCGKKIAKLIIFELMLAIS